MFLSKRCVSITAIFLSGSRLVRSQGGKIIGKTNVALGIRKCGALNEQYQNVFGWGPGDPASPPIGYVGIRNKKPYTDSKNNIFAAGTITGVDRFASIGYGRNEGWSAGTYAPSLSGDNYPQWCGDNGHFAPAPFNMKSCTIRANKQQTKAISTMFCRMKGEQKDFLKVRHKYAPVNGQPNLYRVTVIIQNKSTVTYDDVRYFRMFDWDIDPTPYSEYITHQGTTCSDVASSKNNGFCHPDPNAACDPIDPVNGAGDFTDLGYFDHGSTFEFKIGSLKPRQTKRIKFYYGLSHPDGGGTTALNKILSALNSVGANVYSLGKSDSFHPNLNPTGKPYTFAFGYKCSKKLPLEEDVVGPQDARKKTSAVLQNNYSWINRNKNINCMTDPEILCTGGNRIEGLLQCPRSCAGHCADDETVCAGDGDIDCDNYQLRFACWDTCGLCYQDEGTCPSPADNVFSLEGKKRITTASSVEDYDGVVANPPTDYVLRFTIEPTGLVAGYSSIIHFTTGKNCCGYGTRVPGVWFDGEETDRLFVVTGHDANGNAYLYSAELALNIESNVEILVVGTKSTLSVNGVVVSTMIIGDRSPLSDVKVFIGSPWYTAADAFISNVYFGPA